jgi:DNA-binding NarL/FixJ family response regulator
MNDIRLLLVDDHVLLRHGLAAILEQVDGFAVAGQARNGVEALPLVRSLRPDVVIMDLVMPEMDGVEATRRIAEECPATNVLILTSFGTSADLIYALNAGATGAVLKDSTEADLIEAVRTVARGDQYLSPDIRHMIANDPNPPTLTARQSSILQSISRGLTNADIALQFGLTTNGVKIHLNAILSKLGAANRAEAVSIAFRKHLLKDR